MIYQLWRNYERPQRIKLIHEDEMENLLEDAGLVYNGIDKQDKSFIQGCLYVLTTQEITLEHVETVIMFGDYIRLGHRWFVVGDEFGSFYELKHWPIPFYEKGEYSTLYESDGRMWFKSNDGAFNMYIGNDKIEIIDIDGSVEVIGPGSYKFYSLLAFAFSINELDYIESYFGPNVRREFENGKK